MPKTKNQAKNKSRFEIRGGVLNEYEFALNEGAMTEEERNRFAQMEEERQAREGEEAAEEPLPISPQEREAARIREVVETAHEKAQRNMKKRERSEGGAGEGTQKGAAEKSSKAGKNAGAKRKVPEKSGTITSSKKADAGKKEGASKKGSAGAQQSGAAKGAKKGAGQKASTKKDGRTQRS